MGETGGVDEAAGTDEGAAGGEDLGFPVRCQWDFGGAGVAPVEGPFGFAVAGEEDAGGCHCAGGLGERAVGEGGVLEGVGLGGELI